MIHTAKQLKDKVKNMSGGNSEVLSYNLETLLAEKMQTILACLLYTSDAADEL